MAVVDATASTPLNNKVVSQYSTFLVYLAADVVLSVGDAAKPDMAYFIFVKDVLMGKERPPNSGNPKLIFQKKRRMKRRIERELIPIEQRNPKSP